jgi:uncharacterized membrane protein YhaH (DUF805 family)
LGGDADVTFWDAITTCFTKYVDFKGRASRPEYWWFFLSFIILYFAAAIIGGGAGKSGFGALVGLVFLVYILPLLAAAVRRLHDTGRSGWWYFISLIPLVGSVILLVFLASMGQPGVNQYGPPPGGSPTLGGIMPPPPPPAA